MAGASLLGGRKPPQATRRRAY